jgi:hypothetical protein
MVYTIVQYYQNGVGGRRVYQAVAVFWAIFRKRREGIE